MGSDNHLTPAAVDFLAELRDNNNRAWFQENRQRAEEVLLSPARSLIAEVGELLRKKRPDIIADPRIDRSIYRLNRDTRFSRDKTPYKIHLGLWWWEGADGRLECPGFYYHLTPDGWGWSVGCYRFSETGLNNWRQALLDPSKAKAFRRLISEFTKAGALFGEPELKRAPAGFSPDHPMIEFLRHKGFYSWTEETPHPPELFGSEAAEFVYSRFAAGMKLHDWLVKALF